MSSFQANNMSSNPSKQTSSPLRSSLQKSSPPKSPHFHTLNLTAFPRELHFNVLTYLRATDLSALQRTCQCFNNRDLIVAVVDHAANEVYPPELTEGFDTPIVSGEVKSIAVVSKKNSTKVNPEESEAYIPFVSNIEQKVYTYEMLRNMEMLVVARVLNRPEPPIHERETSFYVSKSWCRAALRWLEVQEEERKEREERLRAAELARAATAAAQCHTPKGGKGKNNKNYPHPGSSGKKKISRKEQRQRDRRLSDAMPPWSNINNDLVCEHGDLKRCSSKSARARRRVMDKQAWKVLKRLYPDSVQLEASVGKGECLLCAAEAETARKAEIDRKEEEKAERKKPLSCPLVRGFYTRGSKGFPTNFLVSPTGLQSPPTKMLKNEESMCASSCFAQRLLDHGRQCPLKPGVYCALPRSWCHRWRKYIKTGEGGAPPAPDASEVLCDAHNLPLVPPHLESFLLGETPSLLCCNSVGATEGVASMSVTPPTAAPALLTSNVETLQALRAAGMSELEVQAQRVAMIELEESRQRASINDVNQARFEIETQSERSATNEQLDRENRVVVEILSDEEVSALEKWWPRVHGFYALRFAVVESSTLPRTEILWSTVPCRECDPSSRSSANLVLRNRLQKRGYR
ncbi:hypothetical protein ACHAXS_007309 [Conticribra weissflogii]